MENTDKRKIIKYSVIGTGLAALGIVLAVKFMQKSGDGVNECTKVKSYPILDGKMANLLAQGSAVEVYENFYKCSEPERGDLVLFRFSDKVDPVVRIVRGVPGDRYTVSKDPGKKNRWKLAINGEEIKTDDGFYYIESNHIPPLKTYEQVSKGTLYENEYILLSLVAPGLSDSSNLGVVLKNHLAGKVKLK